MRFFKDHSYEIVRLFLNQFALAVFGIVLVLASTMANDGSYGILSLIAGVFSALFYLFILYATMQEMGAKDRIKIEGNRMKRDSQCGLKIMLFAQVPNFVLLVLMLLGYLLCFVFGSQAFGLNLYTIARMILLFLQAMYTGIIGYLLPVSTTAKDNLLVLIAYAVSVLPGILVCWGSYILGLKDKKLFSLRKSNS
jgi:hypothetical protein